MITWHYVLWFNENYFDKKVFIFIEVFKDIKSVDAYFCLGWTNENAPWRPLVDRKFLLYILLKIWTKKNHETNNNNFYSIKSTHI
jgi:hypothetical protein